jgi:hypothetical protein
MFNKKFRSVFIPNILLAAILISTVSAQKSTSLKNGLIGILYDDTKFSRPVSIWYLEGVNSDSIQWQTRNDFSARWQGYIKAPLSTDITFHAEADDEIRLVINDVEVINTRDEREKSSGNLKFIAGKYYPLMLEYSQISGISSMKLFWQWQEINRKIIPVSALFYDPDDETKIADSFQSMVKIDLDALAFDVTQIIEIQKSQDVQTKRKNLIQFLWGSDGFPDEKLPAETVQGISDSDFVSLTNLKRIDRLTVNMEFGINSIAYHFIPQQANGELAMYHQGHNGKFSVGIRTIQAFLNKGYSVIALSMPLLGMNNKPLIDFKRFGKIILHSHSQMPFLEPPQCHPIKYFLVPVATCVNYAASFKYKRIIMVGISGGGWTTTLYAAIDPRIKHSFPTAGSLPNYLRARDITNSGTIGDYEQIEPALYRTVNYLEFYILGSFGDGRRQLQILNEFDSCCFKGTGFKTYKDIIKNTVQGLGSGSFDVFLDSTHRLHQISPRALEVIFEDLAKY